MPTKVYEIKDIQLIDGTIIEVSPLKIKYLRQFMDIFSLMKDTKSDNDAIQILSKCVRVAMKQFYPSIKTVEDVEDSCDLQNIYDIIEFSAGIKINGQTQQEDTKKTNTNKDDSNSWESLDLVKLESEVFTLGIWKNFDELESSISMAELMVILESTRELDYNEKKFLAAMQGVDLDEQTGNKQEDPWEAMKARVAAQTSGIGNGDPNDITSLQGQKAQQYGFGIGMGLEYEVVSK